MIDSVFLINNLINQSVSHGRMRQQNSRPSLDNLTRSVASSEPTHRQRSTGKRTELDSPLVRFIFIFLNSSFQFKNPLLHINFHSAFDGGGGLSVHYCLVFRSFFFFFARCVVVYSSGLFLEPFQANVHWMSLSAGFKWKELLHGDILLCSYAWNSL